MGVTIAVIPARGGSSGIPKKNILNLCGKPLIGWSIEHARKARMIDSVWVSSDSSEILGIARRFGAEIIERPAELSNDNATSESAWLHALDVIEAQGIEVDLIVAMQATSPLREPLDLDNALAKFKQEDLDSLFSCCEVEDFFVWKLQQDGRPSGVNHDYKNRQRRQNLEKRYLENGSFYVFTPHVLRTLNNRLGGRIGIYVMEKYKMFQIDNPQDIVLCEIIMRGYGFAR